MTVSLWNCFQLSRRAKDRISDSAKPFEWPRSPPKKQQQQQPTNLIFLNKIPVIFSIKSFYCRRRRTQRVTRARWYFFKDVLCNWYFVSNCSVKHFCWLKSCESYFFSQSVFSISYIIFFFTYHFLPYVVTSFNVGCHPWYLSAR